jgi:hypothetical protein
VSYYDEFTAVNQISSVSKQYKIGAVYYTLGNIDPALRSRVEAIHLLCLFPCELLERYTFDDIMRPFIEEVKQLNESSGHTFHTQKGMYSLGVILLLCWGTLQLLPRLEASKKGLGLRTRNAGTAWLQMSKYNPSLQKSSLQ